MNSNYAFAYGYYRYPELESSQGTDRISRQSEVRDTEPGSERLTSYIRFAELTLN